MKVVLVTGSYPPDVCGVADYSERLANALEKAGARVVVISGKCWGAANASGLNREIQKVDADILHMQYPATGYGWGLGPQALALLRPQCGHNSRMQPGHRILRRLSLSSRSRFEPVSLIFTNEFEQQYFSEFAPWIKDRSTDDVPIGPNVLPTDGKIARIPNVALYFGLIRPEKGLEDVLQMAHLFRQRASGAQGARIVGTVLPGCGNYYARLRRPPLTLPVEWVLDLNDVDTFRYLSGSGSCLPAISRWSFRTSEQSDCTSRQWTGHHIHSRSGILRFPSKTLIQVADSPIKAVEVAEKLFADRRLLQEL